MRVALSLSATVVFVTVVGCEPASSLGAPAAWPIMERRIAGCYCLLLARATRNHGPAITTTTCCSNTTFPFAFVRRARARTWMSRPLAGAMEMEMELRQPPGRLAAAAPAVDRSSSNCGRLLPGPMTLGLGLGSARSAVPYRLFLAHLAARGPTTRAAAVSLFSRAARRALQDQHRLHLIPSRRSLAIWSDLVLGWNSGAQNSRHLG